MRLPHGAAHLDVDLGGIPHRVLEAPLPPDGGGPDQEAEGLRALRRHVAERRPRRSILPPRGRRP